MAWMNAMSAVVYVLQASSRLCVQICELKPVRVTRDCVIERPCNTFRLASPASSLENFHVMAVIFFSEVPREPELLAKASSNKIYLLQNTLES